MKQTEKGLLAINTVTDGNPIITFKPVDNTVWMDRNELCALFGIYMKETNDCLHSIMKMNQFDVNDSCKYHRVVKGNSICYDITEVNLNIIIAMAFRLDSENARILREWLIGRAVGNHGLPLVLPDMDFKYSLN